MEAIVRRIFFDSGMVLVYPVSGDWFAPAVLVDRCAERGVALGSMRARMNLRRAQAYLDDNHSIQTEDEEYGQFVEYYRILFDGLDGLGSSDLVRECARAKVRDYDAYRFYPDVGESIARLGRAYRLGIISDAWPSIFGVYRKSGLLGSFDPFVVSSVHGVTKERKTLFDIALAGIDEEPGECLFVDDSVVNCRIAMRKGMRAVAMCRGGAPMRKWGIPAVRDMAELEAMIESMA